MKQFSAPLSFTLVLASALALTAVAEPAKYSFRNAKPMKVVTEAPAFPAVDAEVKAAVNKRRDEIHNTLYNAGKKQEALQAALALAAENKDKPELWRSAIGRAFDYAKSAGEWKIRDEICDQLLAWPYTKTSDVWSLLEYKGECLDRLADYDAYVTAMIQQAAVPGLDSNNVQRARLRVFRALRDKIKDPEGTLAVAAEVYGDKSVCPDHRAEFYCEAATVLCRTLNKTADASALYREALALDLGKATRARTAGYFATHLQHHCRPAELPEARALMMAEATNSVCAISDRARFVQTLLGLYRNERKAADKLVPVAFAEQFLADNAVALSAGDAMRVNADILANQRQGGDHEAAFETAGKIFASTNAPTPTRRDAASYIASRLLLQEKFAEAEQTLRKTYEFKGMGPNEFAATAKDIGNLYIVRDNLDGALAAYSDCLTHVPADAHPNTVAGVKSRIDGLVLDAYKAFYRFEEGRDLCLKNGDKLGAAKLCAECIGDSAAARKLYLEILNDKGADFGARRTAWTWLFSSEKTLTDGLFAEMLGTTANTTNEMIRILVDKLSRNGSSAAYFGADAEGARICSFLTGIYDREARPYEFKPAQYGAFAFCGIGDFKSAAEVCSKTVASNPKLAPAEAYQMNMMAKLFSDKTVLSQKPAVDRLVKIIAEGDRQFAGEVAPKERVARIERIGCAAMIGNDENLVRALESFKQSLYKPAPVKMYKVRYSTMPISGLGNWDKIQPAPETQLMDRSYGGNMDFLVTDVATGNRGEGINAEQGAKRDVAPTLQIACDEFGIHFRFEAPDEKAAEIAAGFIGGGSYEGYIAPGENQPYICTLLDLVPNARLGLFNTTYNTAGHRRITEKDASLYKSETVFTDKSTVSYFMLSWDAYATLIPDNGAVWDFENFLWGRTGSAAWNGSESIHGRSTWGHLVFDMPEKGRIAILKHQIFKVMKAYNAEKRTGHSAEGVIDHWKDAATGDPEFYDACVKPLVEKLDSYIPLVKIDMSDADVVKVADEALAGWRDIRFTIARLRAQYLAEKLAK